MKIIVLFLIFLTCIISSYTYNEEKSAPQNEFFTILSDINKKLGLNNVGRAMNKYFRQSIRQGQAYSHEKFEEDWRQVKQKPTRVFGFIHKLFWAGIVNSSIKIIELFSRLSAFLLMFLKTKCDYYFGKDAELHPFNILRDQDQQQVSFLIFVYLLAISLVLGQFLSWWNFMVYVAICFLTYSFGGPYLVYKWLLCITAFIWFIFDFALRYPFHVAIAILVLALIGYLKGAFGFASRSYSTIGSGKLSRNIERKLGNIDQEYSALSERLSRMERKTDLLNNRMEMLSRSMDRLQSDAEE